MINVLLSVVVMLDVLVEVLCCAPDAGACVIVVPVVLSRVVANDRPILLNLSAICLNNVSDKTEIRLGSNSGVIGVDVVDADEDAEVDADEDELVVELLVVVFDMYI